MLFASVFKCKCNINKSGVAEADMDFDTVFTQTKFVSKDLPQNIGQNNVVP